ncbi:MAG: hypothetical protein ACM3JG_14235 [Thiohalocapsa sp.]
MHAFPSLRRPDPAIADPAKVRLGDSTISGQFPPLRQPTAAVADPAKVRLGDSTISGQFPVRK